MTRLVLVAIIVLGIAVATALAAYAQITPPQYILLFGKNSSASGSTLATGAILLEAGGSNMLLLENGTDHLCLEAGC